MNVLLAKYDSSGVAQWARTVTAGAESAFASVSLDSTGNVYAGGYIGGNGMYAFGDGVTATGPAAGGPGGTLAGNLALVKYGSSGTAQWARSVAAGEFSGFNGVATDSAGDVYAVGSIGEGTFDFGNGVTATGTEKNGDFTGTAGSAFVVLAKYDSSGAPQWARTVSPGGSNSYLDAVTVDSLRQRLRGRCASQHRNV